jgi:hypothetical protein
LSAFHGFFSKLPYNQGIGMKQIVLIFVLALAASFPKAQAFVNGTLAGTIGISNTPTSWAQVAFGDPVSQSTNTFAATSDVTGTTGPFSGNINGNPYHGTTLVSGLHMQNGSDIWHEGIQQTVTGLTIGAAYSISLYQNVIKQSNATDDTGSWAVYRENTLISVTAVSVDNSPVGSNSHPWHRRVVTFTATATSHLIKFLPRDDDANIVSPAGVRMGLDSITFFPASAFPVDLEYSLSLGNDQDVLLEWETAEPQGLTRFLVEHAPDGIHFEQIGALDIGNQTAYSFVDRTPFIESYYRIGVVQADGGITYTEVKQISTQAPVEALLYGRQLEMRGGYGGVYAVALLDMQGKSVFAQRGPASADLGLLSPGIYFLRVISEGKENAILEKKIFLE